MIILICFVCCSCSYSVTKDEFYRGEYLCRDNDGLNNINFGGHRSLYANCNDDEHIPLNKINYNDYIEYLKKTQSPKAE